MEIQIQNQQNQRLSLQEDRVFVTKLHRNAVQVVLWNLNALVEIVGKIKKLAQLPVPGLQAAQLECVKANGVFVVPDQLIVTTNELRVNLVSQVELSPVLLLEACVV